MTLPRSIFRLCGVGVAVAVHCFSQSTPSNADRQPTIEMLLDRLAKAEARIRQLEERTGRTEAQPNQAGITPTNGGCLAGSNLVATVAPASAPVAAALNAAPVALPASAPSAAAVAGAEIPAPGNPAPDTQISAASAGDPHAHMMDIPGGPTLKMRGFFDFNYGAGPAANPLQFPLGGPAHSTFQAGEFDLYVTSQLSEHLDFVGEMIFGWDQTNELGVDIERYQLTYRPNEYFQISGGRYHSAIGYYNTAYHHGTWFGTATGRPFMYYYEDSGGLLPVHNVGLTAAGLVPGTGKWHLHWIAEGGNGRSSSKLGQPVQNFLADRNHKSFNVAFYIRPEWASGLQLGGSYYRDKLVPSGIAPVAQTITSAYAVYDLPRWEFLNEAVLLKNTEFGIARPFRTPLMYTQLARAFGKYKPYFRYQYVNSPWNDPVNIYTDRYQGPSVGIRWDVSEFAAFKLQYNRLDQRSSASNSVDAQIGMTF